MYKSLIKINHMLNSIVGEEVTLVGGCVRDTLYGVTPKDYDAVICMGDSSESYCHGMIEDIAYRFRALDFKVELYQSYGLHEGEVINPTSFQAMFYSCLKVTMKNCQVDILLSKADTIEEHVKRHDCNMNMVWFDLESKQIKWCHDGNQPKCETLQFVPDVCNERIGRMYNKWLQLNSKSKD